MIVLWRESAGYAGDSQDELQPLSSRGDAVL